MVYCDGKAIFFQTKARTLLLKQLAVILLLADHFFLLGL